MGKRRLYWIAGGVAFIAAVYAMTRHHSLTTPTSVPTATSDGAGGGGGGVAGLPAIPPTPGSSMSQWTGTNALFGGSASGGYWDASPPTIRPVGVPPPPGATLPPLPVGGRK